LMSELTLAPTFRFANAIDSPKTVASGQLPAKTLPLDREGRRWECSQRRQQLQ
jgi:hypothetical protein